MLPVFSARSSVKELISYTYPLLYKGKSEKSDWYVGFHAFDPAVGKMRRKKIKLNFIKKKSDRKRFASSLINRICQQLDNGWNPWIEAQHGKAYHLFSEVCQAWRSFITRMYNDGNYRNETYVGYASYLRNLEKWNAQRRIPITYIYQFDRAYLIEFLDHIFIDRNNCAQTRNNYLVFLRVFSSWLVQHSYLDRKPTDEIASLGKRMIKKTRTVIEQSDMLKLKEYAEKKNKHFLLACYLLHYALIRPKEMSMLRLEHFALEKQTIFVPDSISKNKKSAIVTLPAKIIHLMVDLRVFDHPSHYYLFSRGFLPGPEYRSEKQFRDYWSAHVRQDLKFPTQYKFYSLKDTGITEMLRTQDIISVRDQARHSSILMTDIYTPEDLKKANHLLLNYEGVL